MASAPCPQSCASSTWYRACSTCFPPRPRQVAAGAPGQRPARSAALQKMPLGPGGQDGVIFHVRGVILCIQGYAHGHAFCARRVGAKHMLQTRARVLPAQLSGSNTGAPWPRNPPASFQGPSSFDIELERQRLAGTIASKKASDTSV